jgi:murein L,D-transpeptidase YcbB/YkuD
MKNVKNYQAKHKLPVNGVMDTEMIAQLMDGSQTAIPVVITEMQFIGSDIGATFN